MNNEQFPGKIETHQEAEVTFEIKHPAEGVEVYVFKDLAVAFDTTGKNYKDLPELFFGPYDNELNKGSLNQPKESKQGVNMQYASECIKKVAEASGIHEFWFYPFGGDAMVENKEKRESARMRLFQKISSDIKPAPEGHGYILSI
jgi:hypothetical protein